MRRGAGNDAIENRNSKIANPTRSQIENELYPHNSESPHIHANGPDPGVRKPALLRL